MDSSFGQVCDVSVDYLGNYIVIDELTSRVFLISPTGTLIKAISGFELPDTVASNLDGQIIVCENEPPRINILDREGKIIKMFGSEGSQPG